MRIPKTLILTRKEIKRLVNVKKAITAVENAFKEHGRGRAQMPAKIYLDLKEHNGDFRAMPAYLKGIKASSLKWVNVHPNNKKIGLPTVMAVVILSDPTNGFPLSVMDGTYITSLRTAASGAVAAKYLARKDSRTVSLVGCGVQARTQLEALRQLFRLKEVRVWGNKPAYIKTFIKDMKVPKERMIACKNIESCVRDSDIIVTTTPSRKPLVKLKWVAPGTHINAIGADAKGKQELETAVLKKAKLIIDDWEQASHSGEINVAVSRKQIIRRNVHATLGEIVAKKKKGRKSSREITVFDSTGLAIQDTAVADYIYKTARRQKVGRQTSLI